MKQAKFTILWGTWSHFQYLFMRDLNICSFLILCTCMINTFFLCESETLIKTCVQSQFVIFNNWNVFKLKYLLLYFVSILCFTGFIWLPRLCEMLCPIKLLFPPYLELYLYPDRTWKSFQTSILFISLNNEHDTVNTGSKSAI
jgi:hypothetical protein